MWTGQKEEKLSGYIWLGTIFMSEYFFNLLYSFSR